jgi:hypothetical protein
VFYESDPEALAWLETALAHPARRVRLDAITLLSVVECPQRREWLARSQRDSDPVVRATSALVEAQVAVASAERFDLFESDLGAGLDAADLEWEWEYLVAVCHGVVFPGALTRVWCKREDDSLARHLAVMKAYAGKDHESVHAQPMIVSKRLVTQYTRSPKSAREASRWSTRGRPRYLGR